MREFAEQEVVIPSGPFEGRRYSTDRQPFSRHWFDEVDSGRWQRIFTTGPSQSGKTLQGSVIPVMYHLFEMREAVIYAVPSQDMVADKWAEDLRPAIEASRFKEFLPRIGRGSKGGTPSRIDFANGAVLKFMTAGGSDKKRAGFTSRVVVVTETDGFDETSEASREADKFTQIEARTRAFGKRKRIYAECTVSLKEGRTWQELTKGSDSRLALRCAHCGAYVTPEREHLVGWKEAEDELAAGDAGRLVCPTCGAMWSEDDRQASNRNSLLVHRGQEVRDGQVIGDLPRTQTLGFRWTAANNLLVPISEVAKGEWKASRAANEDNAEKEQRQFVWAMPVEPSAVDLSALDTNSIARRMRGFARGVCPDGTRRLTVGIDTGKWLLHFLVVAWLDNATPHIVDYGRVDVPSREFTQEVAVLTALRRFRDEIAKEGWKLGGVTMHPEMCFIDTGDNDDAVYAFCVEPESGSAYWPIKGYGTTQRRAEKFIRRAKQACVFIGNEYQAIRLAGKPKPLVEINVDHWKGWLHERLQTQVTQPGAMTVFKSDDKNEHVALAKHFTSEKRTEEFVAGRGTVTRWIATHRNNHWLDAGTYACVAGHSVGERLVGEMPAAPKPAVTQETSGQWGPKQRW